MAGFGLVTMVRPHSQETPLPTDTDAIKGVGRKSGVPGWVGTLHAGSAGRTKLGLFARHAGCPRLRPCPALDARTCCRNVKEPLMMGQRVLVLGDSVTVGAGFSGVSEESRYVTLLDRELQEAGVPVELRPSALDGVDTGYALKRFDRMVTQYEPDVLVISLGLNDAYPKGRREICSPEQYVENLTRLTERALQIDAKPVLSTPPPRLDVESTDDFMAPYAAGARRVARSWNLPLVDLHSHFAQRADLKVLLPDGLHPGRHAHRMIAREFAKTLIPLWAGTDEHATNDRIPVC